MVAEAQSSATFAIGSSLVHLVNKLHDLTAPFLSDELSKVSLPEVVVVGSQSSGKSSVLEALVGHDFLPRGSDICTRRPLRLMLENHRRQCDVVAGYWGEFTHLPGTRFDDFNEIRCEIQSETDRRAGKNKGIADEEIKLKIFSPDVLDMTLIDLPGITRIPVGDQPGDIERRIKNMILRYIQKPNSIILAVTPANSDLATSDALQIAKDADPAGIRTIGVITKLDIMDRGTDACNILSGKYFPLRLGYVGVVNRSQEDINRRRKMQEALDYEKHFFDEHPEYNNLSDRCGIPHLASKLNWILEEHIQKHLPFLKDELESCKDAATIKLQSYGEQAELEMEKGALLLNLLKSHCEQVSSMIDGKNEEMLIKQLSGGARIRRVFESIFCKRLEVVAPWEELTDEEIRTAIQNATGVKSSLFIPEVPFEVMIKKQIARLLEPCLSCVSYVYAELLDMNQAAGSLTLQRFPDLRKHIDGQVQKFLHEGKLAAEKMIDNLIEIEKDYINMSHPKFLGGDNAIEQATQIMQAKESQLDLQKIQRGDSTDPDKLKDGPATKVHQNKCGGDGPASDGRNPSSWGIPSMFSGKIGMIPSTLSSGIAKFGQGIYGSQGKSADLSGAIIPEITNLDKKWILVIRLLLQSYFDIVRRNLQDLVPKTIMHFLVNRMKKELDSTLIRELYRESLLEKLLREDGDIAARRKHAQELYRALHEAIETLNEIGIDMF